MTPRPEFRWRPALLHALAALVLTVVVTGVLAAVFDVADPRRFGEGVGRFSLVMMLGGLGVSWLLQTGRRRLALAASGLLLALLVGVAVLVVMAASGRASSRASVPAVDLLRADGALRHPTLGVSIPDPGAHLTPRPELATSQLPRSADSRAWVYADEASGEVVIVLLAGGAATDASTFEDFFSGVLDGQTAAMQDVAVSAQERERSIRWEDRRAHAYVVMAEAIHLRVDAFGLPGGEAVVVVSASPQAERFAALADGVRVGAT
ncbi:MAG: hypothetical protein KDK70_22970 [Myxococcales bacterium]|nr:hypothetical protein [Myxococcales bacterium]